jgi:DNA repair protein RadC
VLVDVGIVFSIALKACASGIIFSHNHPSGRLRPSKHDIYLTEKIVAAAQILDIRVCDHIIVTTEGYFSFKDEGLI